MLCTLVNVPYQQHSHFPINIFCCFGMRRGEGGTRLTVKMYLHYTRQLLGLCLVLNLQINPLTPKDPYSSHTAPLTSKRCILYIYSTNIVTEHFKHDIYSPFFSLQNAVCFIILTYLVLVLFTFYIQSVLKFKKIISAPNG